VIYSALLLGFAGSLHCFGMCGPLSLLVPGDKSKRGKYLLGRLIYNLGRITTYGLLGLIIGLIGEQVGFAVPQKIIFLTSGFGILLYLLLPNSSKNKLSVLPSVVRFNQFIKRSIAQLTKKYGKSTQFVFGLLNGLIPCGLVYAALSAAFITSSITSGVLYMVLFGLGTLPMMMSFGFIGSLIPKALIIKPKLIYGISYFILAAFMLYKGFTTPISHYANSHEMTICTGN
jgi:sulfite exporter TauE/SafE